MSAETEAFLFCTVAAEVLLTCRNNNVETLEHIEPKLNFHFGNYRRKMRHVSYQACILYIKFSTWAHKCIYDL